MDTMVVEVLLVDSMTKIDHQTTFLADEAKVICDRQPAGREPHCVVRT
jgi:hypothetical protein